MAFALWLVIYGFRRFCVQFLRRNCLLNGTWHFPVFSITHWPTKKWRYIERNTLQYRSHAHGYGKTKGFWPDVLVEQTRRITAEVVRMCPMFADQKANNRQDLLTREKPKNRHPRRDIWEARDWSYMPPTGLMIKQKNCHHSYSLWDSTGDFFLR